MGGGVSTRGGDGTTAAAAAVTVSEDRRDRTGQQQLPHWGQGRLRRLAETTLSTAAAAAEAMPATAATAAMADVVPAAPEAAAAIAVAATSTEAAAATATAGSAEAAAAAATGATSVEVMTAMLATLAAAKPGSEVDTRLPVAVAAAVVTAAAVTAAAAATVAGAADRSTEDNPSRRFIPYHPTGLGRRLHAACTVPRSCRQAAPRAGWAARTAVPRWTHGYLGWGMHRTDDSTQATSARPTLALPRSAHLRRCSGHNLLRGLAGASPPTSLSSAAAAPVVDATTAASQAVRRQTPLSSPRLFPRAPAYPSHMTRTWQGGMTADRRSIHVRRRLPGPTGCRRRSGNESLRPP